MKSNLGRKSPGAAGQLVGQVQIHKVIRSAGSANKELNKYSKHITQPKSHGGTQAVLYGTGLELEDMNKAQVGIAS
ncbi:23007_t:CDS:2, partial [Gigaspora rosea]